MMILHPIIIVGETHGPRGVLGVVIAVFDTKKQAAASGTETVQEGVPLYWEDLSNCLPVR
jgi:hypothetical protein